MRRVVSRRSSRWLVALGGLVSFAAARLRRRGLGSDGGQPEAEGIVLDEADAVNLGHVDDLYALLRAIDEAMPPDSILYVEGTSITPDVRQYLAARQADERVKVSKGTVWPKPVTYHLPLVGDNLSRLRALAERHAEPEICDHLVVYKNGRVLLTAYDAGADEVWLRRDLPADTLRRFREVLAVGR